MDKFFDAFVAAFFWIKTFLSPFVIGLVAAFFLWYGMGGTAGHVLAQLALAAGICGGIAFAEYVRRNKLEWLPPEERPDMQQKDADGENFDRKDGE